uniref:Uncharacterized protein n=1 Tax=Oryza brachyantha TaxID=4533 RepID=J3NEA6_ORYBR
MTANPSPSGGRPTSADALISGFSLTFLLLFGASLTRFSQSHFAGHTRHPQGTVHSQLLSMLRCGGLEPHATYDKHAANYGSFTGFMGPHESKYSITSSAPIVLTRGGFTPNCMSPTTESTKSLESWKIRFNKESNSGP